MIIVCILGYVLIGILIQIIAKVRIFRIYYKKGYNETDLVHYFGDLAGIDTSGNTDEDCNEIFNGAACTIFGVLVWPMIIMIAIYYYATKHVKGS